MSGRTDYRIICSPELRGGEAFVRGTDVSVWLIEHLRRCSVEIDAILEDYQTLCREDVIACWEYADDHPDEMDWLICENIGD